MIPIHTIPVPDQGCYHTSITMYADPRTLEPCYQCAACKKKIIIPWNTLLTVEAEQIRSILMMTFRSTSNPFPLVLSPIEQPEKEPEEEDNEHLETPHL